MRAAQIPGQAAALLLFVCLLLASGAAASGAVAAAETAATADKSHHLQQLADRTAAGETLLLPPGSYDGPLVLDREITVKAAQPGTVTIRSTGSEAAVTIAADGVTLIGLAIDQLAAEKTAAVIVQGNRFLLEQLTVRSMAFGIVLRNASDGIVRDNRIEWQGAGAAIEAEADQELPLTGDSMSEARGALGSGKSNGIDLYHSHRNELSGNRIVNVYDGIYMENADDNKVIGNRIEQSRYGIHCMYTKRSLIKDNEGDRNVTGAMLMTSTEITLLNNRFEKQSENVNSQGILLFDVQHSTFAGNRVEGNRVGLYIELSSNNRVIDNDVIANFIGIQLLDASDNEMTGNLFQNNTSDAQSRGSGSNRIYRNYWESFRGVDADGDGASDIRYAIHPLFQGLVKKRPAFQLFFHSPGMLFLESLYQSDSSNWTTDTAPLMAPPGRAIAAAAAGNTSAPGWLGLLLLGGAAVFIRYARRREE